MHLALALFRVMLLPPAALAGIDQVAPKHRSVFGALGK
jgi:hypothetical protein